jgi:hypothetical protein
MSRTYNVIKEYQQFLLQEKNLGGQKYSHIKTGKIVEKLQNFGWNISDFSVKRKDGEAFYKQFHIARMRNENFKINDDYLEVIIGNSYDCSKSAYIKLGVYRVICANGLEVGDTFFSEKFKHIGINKEQKMLKSVQDLLEKMPMLISKIEKMQNKQLTPKEKFKLAYRCLRKRKFNAEKNVIDFQDFLKPLREGDKNNDAYSVLNVVQEKLLRTGVKVTKGRKIAPISEIKRQSELNGYIFDQFAA